jgi:hypothetical protein
MEHPDAFSSDWHSPKRKVHSLGGFDARTNALSHHSRDPTPWGYLLFACLLSPSAAPPIVAHANVNPRGA